MSESPKAIFLDRDGVLIVDKHYLKDPAEVELIPHAQEALRKMLQAGYMLFLFTNQSGVSRGYYTIDDVNACNARMLELLALTDPGFTQICIAPEAPKDPQVYRKPSPKFILEMLERYQLDAKNSWMLGDKLTDLEAGVNAGIKSAWLATGKPKNRELEGYRAKNSVPEFSNLIAFERSSLLID